MAAIRAVILLYDLSTGIQLMNRGKDYIGGTTDELCRKIGQDWIDIGKGIKKDAKEIIKKND